MSRSAGFSSEKLGEAARREAEESLRQQGEEDREKQRGDPEAAKGTNNHRTLFICR
jgi:hypothetical protein